MFLQVSESRVATGGEDLEGRDVATGAQGQSHHALVATTEQQKEAKSAGNSLASMEASAEAGAAMEGTWKERLIASLRNMWESVREDPKSEFRCAVLT